MVINFGAGPAKLPVEVMLKAQQNLRCYNDTQISVMEMSHRSRDYDKLNADTQNSLRQLLKVPDNYQILFMQGGGTGMMAAVALNLMGKTGEADYFVTGIWSAKAAKEAEKYGKVNLVLPKVDKYTTIPDKSTWKLSPNASYVYYCDNETVQGIEFNEIPETNGVPLVVDMSSNILSKPLDINKFGVIFAGAQKNIGPPGVVIVIVRDDLLGNQMRICPSVFDFSIMTKEKSLFNTPPTFGVYMIGLVFDWIKECGGVEEMDRRADKKSSMIYSQIESSSGFYNCKIDKKVRSRMNVPFWLATPEMEAQFLKGAEALGMIQLKGHRTVGGIRASLYNAVTVEEVQVLCNYMKEFQNKNSS